MNYYTLETHLEEISKQDAKFELLNSVWKLNKKTLTSALTAVNFNFPHYSLHESGHSDTIISNIESFLGEERIQKLEPTDTWLILMSAYSHDIGMVILQKTIEESLAKNTLHDYLNTLVNESKDQDLKESAQLLLDIQSHKLAQNKSVFDIRKAITLITGEFFRRNHYLRSQAILSGKDEEFKKILSNFYSDLIPNRLLHLLGEVAFSHGTNFNFILEALQKESNGISRDKVHPRFVASLLRLGDILDVDDKRFNPVSERLIDSQLPKTSELHKIKHASVKHLLIKPTLIEVTVDCPEIQVYRIARQWFDWLEQEVEDQYKNWSSIAPFYLIGNPPTIAPNGIKVLYQSQVPDPELMNLRFSIKPQKAIEIFEGKGIYEDSSYVFLRELVQNALDANKIQLWKDILNGNYNEILYEHLSLKYNSIKIEDKKDIHKFIIFPDDIPPQVIKNYQTDLFITWTDNKKGIIIKVVDRGCGISREDLLRMTANVGESRSKDLYFQELKKTLPYWLKPTGAFGIGLQSVFLVADSFKVKTKADNDISYEISFNSSKNGEYSFIINSNMQYSRGTTVEVDP
ncbi:MAG: HD domain-containing protein [Adhaeribacter sp.]